jgi:UDP-N-acetyl-2-amino-2-deoxyglucuronate dehydrogenase
LRVDAKKTSRFAVIGLGHIGRRHVEMILRHESAELVAVCDTNEATYDALLCENARFYTNVNAMLLAETDIEIVNICTPNGLHAAHTLLALAANKHVVVEKPLTTKKSDAEQIIYTALNKARHVFCVMQNRYSPPSQWLKSVVEQGILGEIYMVQLNCFWNRDERYYTPNNWHGTAKFDGGTLFTQFSHFIDIMYWLFGDITNIQAKFRDFNHQNLTDFEDSGMVLFDFLQGGCGVLNYSTSVFEQNLESSMTIIAENGSVKIGGQYMNEVEYCHIKNYKMPVLAPTNAGNDYGAYKGSAQNHHYVIHNIIEVLQGKNSITTNALEGLKVVDIIERIYQTKQP